MKKLFNYAPQLWLIIALILFSAFLVYTAYSQDRSLDPNEFDGKQLVGRFQLVTGSVPLGHTLYRIDTLSGRTWIYGEVKQGDKLARAWVRLEESSKARLESDK